MSSDSEDLEGPPEYIPANEPIIMNDDDQAPAKVGYAKQPLETRDLNDDVIDEDS